MFLVRTGLVCLVVAGSVCVCVCVYVLDEVMEVGRQPTRSLRHNPTVTETNQADATAAASSGCSASCPMTPPLRTPDPSLQQQH